MEFLILNVLKFLVFQISITQVIFLTIVLVNFSAFLAFWILPLGLTIHSGFSRFSKMECDDTHLGGRRAIVFCRILFSPPCLLRLNFPACPHEGGNNLQVLLKINILLLVVVLVVYFVNILKYRYFYYEYWNTYCCTIIISKYISVHVH